MQILHQIQMIIKIKKQKKNILIIRRSTISNKITANEYSIAQKDQYVKFGIKKKMSEKISQSFNRCLQYNTMYMFNNMKDEIKTKAINELEKINNDKKQLEEEVMKLKKQLRELAMEIQVLDASVYKYEELEKESIKDQTARHETNAEEILDEWVQSKTNNKG